MPINMTILSFAVALLMSAASPPAVDQGRASFRRFGFDPNPELGARIAVAMPSEVTTIDVEQWISELELGPEAAATLRAAVDDFYGSRTPEIVKVVEPVDRAAVDLARRAALQPLMRLPDAPEAFRELVRLRDRAVSRLNALEEELFAHVGSAVSPDAPETVADVIRQLRRRTRHDRTPPELPMASVDLRAVEMALDRESQIEILDREARRAARLSYDFELATLHERRVRLALDMRSEDLRNFRESNYDTNALVESRTKQNRRQLAVERSIIAANRRWADAFAEVMSPVDADRWRDAVRAATYPSLYPNPVDLRSLDRAVQALEASDSGGDLEAARQTLVREIARIASMEPTAESEVVAVAVSESRGMVVQELRHGLEESIALLQRERCEAAARAVEACKAVPQARDMPELSALISAMQLHCGKDGGNGSANPPQSAANSDRSLDPMVTHAVPHRCGAAVESNTAQCTPERAAAAATAQNRARHVPCSAWHWQARAVHRLARSVKAPIVIGRDHLGCGSVASPNRETEAMLEGTDAVSDWAILNFAVNTASGASWTSFHHSGVGIGFSQHAGQVIVADGSDEAAARIERVLTSDPMMDMFRRADAGYEVAKECARAEAVKLPML